MRTGGTEMGKKAAALILALVLLAGACPVLAEDGYRPAAGNEEGFVRLLTDLYLAARNPSGETGQTVAADLAAIRSVSETDGEIAASIADHWERTFLNPDYRPCLYGGGERAEELLQSGIPDSRTHAFVVPGYELRDGKMTRELKGRCDAAAAAARAYPEAILVCSGGATGSNNPKNHTEAGLMKRYLVRTCGIDESRIFTDEKAISTLENAVNTFRILREQGVRTFTVVTSSYHQRWGQALYSAMAAVCRGTQGYEAELVGDYSYEMEPKELFRDDAKWAAAQLGTLLQLPKAAVEQIRRAAD